MKILTSTLLLWAIVAMGQQPILTTKQQIELATAQQVVNIEYHKLQELPGFKEQAAKVQTAQQKLVTLQEQFCQSKDGKKYHLELTSGVWSCREDKQ